MNPFRSSEYGEFPCIENPVLLKYIALDVISGRKIPSLSILNVDLIIHYQNTKIYIFQLFRIRFSLDG